MSAPADLLAITFKGYFRTQWKELTAKSTSKPLGQRSRIAMAGLTGMSKQRTFGSSSRQAATGLP